MRTLRIFTTAIGRRALLSGLIFGAFLALLLPSAASAHLYIWNHTQPYTYNSNTCSQIVDPVSVIFYNNASISQVHSHAGHHGGWDNHDGTAQWFYDHGCGLMDHQDASRIVGFNRVHMREWWNGDPYLGTYTLASPHKEKVDLTCGHVVYGNDPSPPGGFVQGKWDIGYNWHNWNNGGGSHYFLGYFWYGNTARMTQCNGEIAWNDGYIDYVEIQ